MEPLKTNNTTSNRKEKHLCYIKPCGKRSVAIEVIADYAEPNEAIQKEIDRKIIKCLFGI